MTGYSIMGLVDPPGRIVGGRIVLDGVDLATLDRRRRCGSCAATASR